MLRLGAGPGCPERAQSSNGDRRPEQAGRTAPYPADGTDRGPPAGRRRSRPGRAPSPAGVNEPGCPEFRRLRSPGPASGAGGTPYTTISISQTKRNTPSPAAATSSLQALRRQHRLRQPEAPSPQRPIDAALDACRVASSQATGWRGAARALRPSVDCRAGLPRPAAGTATQVVFLLSAGAASTWQPTPTSSRFALLQQPEPRPQSRPRDTASGHGQSRHRGPRPSESARLRLCAGPGHPRHVRRDAFPRATFPSV